jgi:hypothetical protein
MWGTWASQYSSGDDDDNNNSQDGGDDSQETETAQPAAAGCLEDRCTSSYISWVQQSLNQFGAALKPTGLLDRATINALNAFKRKSGVPAREYYASPVIEKALLNAGASQPPPVRRLQCGPTPAQQLASLINKYRGDIPVHYLMAWITVESGGKLGDLTKLCERGYFQVHPEESQDLGLDPDRMSTDPEYSVAGGLRLVKRYAAGVEQLSQQFGFPKTGDLYWGLVKLRHWIPSAAQRLLLRMKQDGVPVTSWEGIRQYVFAHPQLSFGGFDPRLGVNSVDHFLSLAKRWQIALADRGTTPAQGAQSGQAAVV